MNLLQINSTDFLGNRFNGYSIGDELRSRGIKSQHLVWRRYSKEDPSVGLLYEFPGNARVTRAINGLERFLSIQSMLHLQSFGIRRHPWFKSADVVHYHLIHDGYLSFASLPMLSRLKPSVWTFHDPWPLTGHCLYPMDCNRWQSGCGNCPDLHTPFAVKKDRTRLNWKYKKSVYSRLDMDIVVASRWMKNLTAQSPLTRGFRFHVVPFGLDCDRFKPADPRDKEEIRRRLGILPGRIVFAYRAVSNPFKGLEQLKQALRQLKTDKQICILTTQEKGVFDEFLGDFQIIELGWTNDEDLLISHFQAADFFVMPSMAEAFGLMAIEAMACGLPVLCFEGTSLPDVTFAPNVGLAVPRTADALAAAITRWVEDADEVMKRGRKAREIAKDQYALKLHLDRLTSIYREAADRRMSQVAP